MDHANTAYALLMSQTKEEAKTIADILEKSKGSVRVLIHRALKVVRELSTSNERPADHQ